GRRSRPARRGTGRQGRATADVLAWTSPGLAGRMLPQIGPPGGHRTGRMASDARHRPPSYACRRGGPARMANMHEIDYRIVGEDMQYVEVELDPGEATVAEAGGMMYMDDGIE